MEDKDVEKYIKKQIKKVDRWFESDPKLGEFKLDDFRDYDANQSKSIIYIITKLNEAFNERYEGFNVLITLDTFTNDLQVNIDLKKRDKILNDIKSQMGEILKQEVSKYDIDKKVRELIFNPLSLSNHNIDEELFKEFFSKELNDLAKYIVNLTIWDYPQYHFDIEMEPHSAAIKVKILKNDDEYVNEIIKGFDKSVITYRQPANTLYITSISRYMDINKRRGDYIAKEVNKRLSEKYKDKSFKVNYDEYNELFNVHVLPKEYEIKVEKPASLSDTANLMDSKDYKERFKAEYFQTKIKRDRLNALIYEQRLGEEEGNETKYLGFTFSSPISLLYEQLEVMNEYLNILEKRAIIEKIDL